MTRIVRKEDRRHTEVGVENEINGFVCADQVAINVPVIVRTKGQQTRKQAKTIDIILILGFIFDIVGYETWLSLLQNFTFN